MSSSMRNAVQRRNHRERAQPEERAKWGLLEKHKDYSARAKDFNFKKMKLKQLRQKVAEKNPDEFYFGMVSRKGPSTTGKNRTGTVNGDRGNKELSQDTVRLLKTQDLGYIRTARNKTEKDVKAAERLVAGIKWTGKGTVFVDDEAEQSSKVKEARQALGVGDDEDSEDEEEDFGLDDMDDEFGFDEDDKDGADGKTQSPPEDPQDKARRLEKEKWAAKLGERLQAAKTRLKALADAEDVLELTRAKMAKSVTIGGINKHGVRYKIRERKR